MRPYILPLTPGTAVIGLWCNTCELPSVERVPLSVVTKDGVITIGTLTHCTNCHRGGHDAAAH